MTARWAEAVTGSSVRDGDDVATRLRRHARGIALVVAACLGLGAAGQFSGPLPWWSTALSFAITSAVIATAHARWSGTATGALHRRAAVQATSLQVVAVMTGWAFALPSIHLFGLSDALRTGGVRAVRISLAWAAVTVGATQLLDLGGGPAGLGGGRTTTVALVGVVVIALAARRLQESATIRERALEDLHQSADRFRSMIEDATDLVLLVTDGEVEYASPSTARLFGCAADDLTGRSLVDLVHPEDRAHAIDDALVSTDTSARNQRLIEVRMQDGGGEWYVLEGSSRALLAGADGRSRSVLNLRDISERRRLERELAHRASHDAVSGLANRALFRIRAQQAIRRPVEGQMSSLVLVELDGFTRMQGSLGQRAADAAIREIARRVTGVIGDGDLAARLGDWTIAILSHHDHDVSVCTELAGDVLDAVAKQIELPEGIVQVVGTAGCAAVTEVTSVEDLLARAEVALEEARARGLQRTAFDPTRHARALAVRELEHEIGAGLENGDFRVYYQPLVDLQNQEVLGFEALVRWQHAERGMVSPGDFIPAAERSGAIVPLGRWVLQESCRALARLQAEFPRESPLYVTVNVAAQQLAEPALVEEVRQAIRDSGIAPGTLTIEITESSLVDNVDQAIMMLEALRGLGCRIAIDDFGTGYSSLSQLQQFPLDILKVDRAFIQGLRQGDRNSAITEAIVSLSQRLELRTVAEGIETGDDLDTVMSLACNIGQGYFFGRPADEAQAVATLQQRLADLELAARLAQPTTITP